MRLLEVVRGEKTAKDVIATAMQLGRKVGKIPVLVGVCHGFVGNRMLAERQREANRLILEGVTPWDVDRVIHDFGLPMGPFTMSDLAGLDIGWSRETNKSESVRDLLCEQDRRGQKTGAGFYDYDAKRKATPSEVTEEIIARVAERQGVKRRDATDQEILERTLYPMVNEGAKILEEGKAIRASDIDIVWINGYGWPVYRGGPMFWADTIGLPKVLERLRAYQAEYGDAFKPAACWNGWRPRARASRTCRASEPSSLCAGLYGGRIKRRIPSPEWERGRGEGDTVPQDAEPSRCQHNAQCLTLKRVTLTPNPSPTRERGGAPLFSPDSPALCGGGFGRRANRFKTINRSGGSHGPSLHPRGARLPPGSPHLLPGKSAAGDPPEDDRRAPPVEGRHRHLAEDPQQEGLGGAELARRVGRHRLGPGAPVHLPRRAPELPGAVAAAVRRLHGRAGHRPVRQRGAEEALPAPHRQHRRLVVPGFSEPGSGSDLASLKTKAVREGDTYVVNGQKTWTTLGQYADWIFCLVRTDATVKKQEGISFLLIDMKTPGITVRPIQTIDGGHEVNEVFFDDVKVPVENLVGQENKAGTTPSSCSATSAPTSPGSASRSSASGA